jgi:hypothetical protein
MARKNSFTADDLQGLLLDPKVLEALGKALAPIIAQSIEANLSKRIEELSATVKSLKESNDTLLKKSTDAEHEISELRKRVAASEVRIEDVDIYSRSHDLIIRGLPESSYAERASAASNTTSTSDVAESSAALDSAIIELCNQKLGVSIDRIDISVAHRLRASAQDRCRPVIVRFTSRRARDAVFRAKKELKSLPRGNAIFISEHLTRSASTLFFEARKLLREKKIAATWTSSGLVNIKMTTEASERPTVIRSLTELEAKISRSRH